MPQRRNRRTVRPRNYRPSRPIRNLRRHLPLHRPRGRFGRRPRAWRRDTCHDLERPGRGRVGGAGFRRPGTLSSLSLFSNKPSAMATLVLDWPAKERNMGRVFIDLGRVELPNIGPIEYSIKAGDHESSSIARVTSRSGSMLLSETANDPATSPNGNWLCSLRKRHPHRPRNQQGK